MMNSNFLSTVNLENFEQKALEVFRFQSENIPIYKAFINQIGVDVQAVDRLDKIPFLPIEFFKTHQVCLNDSSAQAVFTSSGTTGMQTSKHYVQDASIYEWSFVKAFETFYGSASDYCFLALLPSYLEREGSSLIYMCDYFIRQSNHPDSGFYLYNLDELAVKLKKLDAEGQKTILIGVSYALLDILEQYSFELNHTIVMETGGMKGRRKEMIKAEFYERLRKGFGVSQVHSEYGMTELLSQAYSFDNGQYHCPPWMKILIRDTYDPFYFLENAKTGGINIIDLANIYSCAFIATQDLGVKNTNGTFSVLGRFDDSDIRGCNLMVG